MTDPRDEERPIIAGSLLTLAASLAVWTGASAWLAARHMAATAMICGVSTPHCVWCVSALAGLSAALAALWAAHRTTASAVRLTAAGQH